MTESLQPTVLVVEDEEAIAVLIRYNLEREGFKVQHVVDGEEALFTAEELKPDLILLDWMLPSLPGIEVCRKIREKEAIRGIPVIMLTARGEESDRIKGLDSGADDYIVKPFSPKELIARCKAVLRRTRPVFAEKVLECFGLKVDISSHKASFNNLPIHLGPTEFRLLCHLMERPGHVFTREQLLNSVWGHDVYVEVRTVDVHIRRLRKALSETSPGAEDYVRTVRSAGYTLSDKDDV